MPTLSMHCFLKVKAVVRPNICAISSDYFTLHTVNEWQGKVDKTLGHE
jgi:hypothetical protein